MIRILVVDDHRMIREGLVRVLEDEADIEIVGDLSSGEEAIDAVRQQNVDVVIMDMKMPGIGGLEATKRICQSSPETKVVMVTGCLEEPYLSRVLDSGASGYISKAGDIAEILQAVRKTHRGERHVGPDVAQALALRSQGQTPFETLSERELQIAQMIIECHRVADIADKLCVTTKTVNTYRYRLFEKLNVNSDVELTLLAARNGMLDIHDAN